jgi:hypothetical protein
MSLFRGDRPKSLNWLSPAILFVLVSAQAFALKPTFSAPKTVNLWVTNYLTHRFSRCRIELWKTTTSANTVV